MSNTALKVSFFMTFLKASWVRDSTRPYPAEAATVHETRDKLSSRSWVSGAVGASVGDRIGLKDEERGGDGKKNKRIDNERSEDKGVNEIRK